MLMNFSYYSVLEQRAGLQLYVLESFASTVILQVYICVNKTVSDFSISRCLLEGTYASVSSQTEM